MMYFRASVLLALACCALCASVEQKAVPDKAEGENQAWEKPAYCNGLDCPEFTVIKKTKDYEYREYKKSMWVKNTEKALSIDEVRSPMFRSLFRYIAGNNDKNQVVAMTAPVTIKYTPGAGPACESNFTMGFFVADEVAPTAPKPTEEGVFLESHGSFKVYVRMYPGFSYPELELREISALNAALPAGTKVIKSFWYYAGYDSPFKPFDRHNEVWLIEE